MLRAIIFDCDGVLADSEPLHFRALAEVLAGEGIRLAPDEYNRELLGMTDTDLFRRSFARSGRTLDEARLAALLADKAQRYERMARAELQAIPGAAGFVRRMARRYPLAVCSGANRSEIDMVLARLGVADCFRAIISAQDVPRGKPDPAGYLLALARLNEVAGASPSIAPGECLVIEDSRPGVAAARAAGMRVVRLTAAGAPADSTRDEEPRDLPGGSAAVPRGVEFEQRGFADLDDDLLDTLQES